MFWILSRITWAVSKLWEIPKSSSSRIIQEIKKNAEEILIEAFKELVNKANIEKIERRRKDTKIDIAPSPKSLSSKEVAKLIWHSFRLSSGNPTLQFSMLFSAYLYYWGQEVNHEECENEFIKILQIWETHTQTREWEELDWRPPHPKINRIVTETHTDIWISISCSHKKITSSNIEKHVRKNPFIKMLLTGQWFLARSDRDGWYSISRDTKLEYKEEVIERIFWSDFSYLLKKEKENYNQWKYDVVYPGRPNRESKYDGTNTLKDRYFSYFVWFILKENSTGNDFFDIYFEELRKTIKEWFHSLPKDAELPEYSYPHRNDIHSNTHLTQEDVLYLIAHYNLTHPKTLVVLEEIL